MCCQMKKYMELLSIENMDKKNPELQAQNYEGNQLKLKMFISIQRDLFYSTA